jgi:hypothetical protein
MSKITRFRYKTSEFDKERLLKRRLAAMRKWDLSMRRDGYKDDPSEEEFTDYEFELYHRSHLWRLLVHKYENMIDRMSSHATESLTNAPPTYYDCYSTIEELASVASLSSSTKKGK